MADTRTLILHEALKLFRRRGFERTTMRDVAEAAGMSLGAAYYYFASKEAIVLAYYEEQQRDTAAALRDRMAGARSPRERIGAVFHARLDVLARDRKLLGALFRGVGDPSAPASPFGDKTRVFRETAIGAFRESLAGTPLEGELLETTASALWALQMAVLLYFLHDRSPKQQRTRKLVDDTLDLVLELLPFAPALGPVLARVTRVLQDAGLMGAPQG